MARTHIQGADKLHKRVKMGNGIYRCTCGGWMPEPLSSVDAETEFAAHREGVLS